MKRTPMLRETCAFALMPIIALFGLHFFFLYAGYYDTVLPELDTIMHLLGGAAVAFAAWSLFEHAIREKHVPRLPRAFFLISVLGVVALVGIFWEFYEFLNDTFSRTILQGSLADTMKDLSNDLLGAILFIWIGKRSLKK